MAETNTLKLEARAVARWVRITPRKMRLVANMVRGKRVGDAVNELAFTLKRSSVPVEKTVRSALANLMQRNEASKIDPDDVVISEIRVDEGATAKRWRPRAMGRAYRILKRSSHLTVVLSAHAPVVTAPAKAPKSPRTKKTEKAAEPASK
jgi:large subunit ribosomal protein L22